MLSNLKKRLSNAKLVIVDFDGTLVYLEINWSEVKEKLSNFCKNKFNIEQSFQNLDEGLKNLKQYLGSEEYQEILGILSNYEINGYKGEKNQHLIDILMKFKKYDKGKIAIFSSNCRKTLETIIPKLKIDIDYMVAKDDVGKTKPSDEGLRKILKKFNLQPKDVVFIGNSVLDKLAGSSVGIETIIIDNFLEEKIKLNKIAETHDYSSGFNGKMTKYRALTIRELYKGGGTLLDLGAGDGNLTSKIAHLFEKITLVEASEKYLHQAKNKLKKHSVTFHEKLIEHFDTKEKFDLILASGVLEHLTNPEILLNKVKNWLKDDGFFLVIVPNASSFHRRVGMQIGIIRNIYELSEQDFAVGHRRYYDLKTLRKEIIKQGFKVIKTGGILFKILPNREMEKLSDEYCDALFEIGKKYPNFCAEIYAFCKR